MQDVLNTSPCLEGTLQGCGLNLAYKRWHQGAPVKIIALHGWLDNAASFDFIAPHLTDADIVAYDMAGHGQSEHRSACNNYNLWQEVQDVFAIADSLGWQHFSLLGHSRGAMAAILSAGTFPDRIESLLLIDGGLPEASPAEMTPSVLAKAIRQRQTFAKVAPSKFSSRDTAIKARTNSSFMPVTQRAAEALATRSLRFIDSTQQYYWHADQRLKASSDMKLSKEQLEAFMNACPPKRLCILFDEGIYPSGSDIQTRLEQFTHRNHYFELPGNHHAHMDYQAFLIASKIQHFLHT